MTKKVHKFSEPVLLIYIWTSCGICLSFTVARGWVRWRQQKRFHCDDIWAFVSAISLLTVAVHLHYMLPAIYETQRYGDLDPPHWPAEKYAEEAPKMLKLLFSMMIFFWTTLWSVKASFLMLIERLVTGLMIYKRWWWVVVTVTIMMYIGSVMNNVLACLPFERRWSLDPEQSCSKPEQLERSNLTVELPTVFDVISDIAILIMPVWILSSLMLARAKRMGIIVMFLLSLLVVCIAVVRVVLVSGLGEQIDLVLLVTWSWTEDVCAVFIVNIPPFKAILTRVFRLPASTAKSNSPSYLKGFKASLSGQRSQSSQIPSDSHVQLDDLETGRSSMSKGAASVTESESGLTCQAHAFPFGVPETQHTGIAITSEIHVTSELREGALKPTRSVKAHW